MIHDSVNTTLTLKNKQKSRVILPLLFPLSLIACLILNGCSTTSRKDGPPPFDVDESTIPDAIPKKEALSKYGNDDTYRVLGRSYHTMKSYKHYQAQGMASWYGTKFNDSRTSSGERYNMLAMTAAHRTLPLPSYVQVTNLANHKKVIVKVNDRGPFEGNRLIDLSYVAAKKLGMLGHGTARVDVRSIDPEEYRNQINQETPVLAHNTHKHTRIAHSQSHSHSTVYLQVGTFKNRAYAERLKTRLGKSITTPTHITRTASSNKAYRVQIGPIKNIATAHQISKKLKSLGINTATQVNSATEIS